MSRIRIISGIFGSRLIDTPKNNQTHPMGNRERQAIFNQIKDYISQAEVLDAFAGSGALGFEAISRGAKSVDFIENEAQAIATIKKNAANLNCSDKISIFRKPNFNKQYDVIFIDPPYNNPQYKLVENIAQLLRPGGILVLSHPADPTPPDFLNLQLVSDRKYAAAIIKIFSSRQDAPNSV